MLLPVACMSFPAAKPLSGILGMLSGKVDINLCSYLNIQIGPQITYKFGPSLTYNASWDGDDPLNPATLKEKAQKGAVMTVFAALATAAISCGGINLSEHNDKAIAELAACKTATGLLTAGTLAYLLKKLGPKIEEE